MAMPGTTASGAGPKLLISSTCWLLIPGPMNGALMCTHQAKAREAAAALEPAAQARAEAQPFTGDPEHRFARHDQDVLPLRHHDLVDRKSVV
jgi:hypothetical protein